MSQAYKDSLVARLNELQEKIFDLRIEDKVHQISFKIEEDRIVLFLHNLGGFDDRILVIPQLRLNLGRHFLPDSINLDGELPDTFEKSVEMGCELDSGADSAEAHEIMAEITKIGFLKWVGLKK